MDDKKLITNEEIDDGSNNIQERIQERILKKLDMTCPPDDEELQALIMEEIRSFSENERIPLKEQIRLGRALFHSFRKLDMLQELVEDKEITEIMVNGPDSIFVEKHGKITELDKSFSGKNKLEDVVQQIAASSNRIVNEYSPIVDARLPDGSRVNIVLPPIALNGPIITIRKFPEKPMTMEDLIRLNALDREIAEFLKKLVISKYNIFVSGGTGAGKTTFLNALSEFIPKDERIITIEDNAELQLLNKPNLVRLESRNQNTEGTGEISIRQLIKTALRMRPDRIIVGEVRSEEAIDMIQAMNTGHDGSLSTGHANSPEDMLTRLETMVLMGMELPLQAVQKQLSSGIDIIVHLGRMRDKSRKLFEIVEVGEAVDGKVRTKTLYRLEKGGFQKVGELENIQKLEQAGFI